MAATAGEEPADLLPFDSVDQDADPTGVADIGRIEKAAALEQLRLGGAVGFDADGRVTLMLAAAGEDLALDAEIDALPFQLERRLGQREAEFLHPLVRR